MFSFGPSTPPANHAKGPPLSNRSKHEIILCTSASEAVRRKASNRSLCNTCSKCELVDVFLYRVMCDWLPWLQYSISSHGWKNIIMRFKRSLIDLLFQIGDPCR